MNDIIQPGLFDGSKTQDTCVRTFNFMGTPVRVVMLPDGDEDKRVSYQVTDKIHFVASDLCTLLGYKNSRMAVSTHCKGAQKFYTLQTPGGPQNYRVVNEADMYRLVCGSKMPNAEAFSDWVFAEVLPTIRKEGMYITNQKLEEILHSPEMLLKTLTDYVAERKAHAETKQQLVETKAELDHQIEKIGILEPAAAFASEFLAAEGNILVRQFATHVKQALKLKKCGQQKMFEWLKSRGYMNQDRYPSKRASEGGWLHVIEGVHFNPVTGQNEVHHTTKITPKGQKFFYEKIKKEVEDGKF